MNNVQNKCLQVSEVPGLSGLKLGPMEALSEGPVTKKNILGPLNFIVIRKQGAPY